MRTVAGRPATRARHLKAGATIDLEGPDGVTLVDWLAMLKDQGANERTLAVLRMHGLAQQ